MGKNAIERYNEDMEIDYQPCDIDDLVFPKDRSNRQNDIDFPNNTKFINGKLKNIGKPKIKYIYLTKVKESIKPIYKNGLKGHKRLYQVAILTDKNRFFFSSFYMRSLLITPQVINKVFRIILYKYEYTKESVMSVHPSVDMTKEPIGILYYLVGMINRIQVRKVDRTIMLHAINTNTKYVIPSNPKTKITKWWNNRILKKIFALEKFEFITEPNWFENLDNETLNYRESAIDCAISILYMYLKQRIRRSIYKYKDKCKENPENIRKLNIRDMKIQERVFQYKREVLYYQRKINREKIKECDELKYNILDDIEEVVSNEESYGFNYNKENINETK